MKKVSLLIFSVGSVCFSSFVSAQMMPGAGMSNGESICERIISDSESAVEPETKRENVEQRVQQQRQKQDQQIIQKRSLSRENRRKSYQAILDQVGTGEKKAALESFEQEVEAAISGFQNAHDQIISSFRTRLDEIFSEVEITDQKTDLGMVKNIEMQVFMKDMKVYCEEEIFTEEEISQMYSDKMSEFTGQGSDIKNGNSQQNQQQGYLANNAEVLELKDKKSQELNMARNQMRDAIKNAAEKLKASI